MNLIYVFFSFHFYLHYQINQCISESVTFFSTERPVVHWFDPKYIRNVSVSSKRLSRRDLKHYVEVYLDSLITFDNTVKLDIYFYQFLTNRYRPSFVEMHLNFCDMMNSDNFFGQVLRNAVGGLPCPYPPGIYHLKNMSLPYVPKSFPFNKGRIYGNASLNVDGVTRYFGQASIDMEIKVVKINKKK